MRETHVPLESVWERLVRAVEEGSKPLSKSLKGSKLRRTSNLTFSKTGLKLHTKKQWLRLSLRTIEYATNTYKKYFYTFTINKIIFTNGERKKERPNFYGMFSQNLPISTAFIAILEMELPQCNVIGVRTPPGSEPGTAWVQAVCALWLRCIMVVKWNNKSFASCRGRVNISGRSKITWINVEFNGNSLSVAVPSKIKKRLRACATPVIPPWQIRC